MNEQTPNPRIIIDASYIRESGDGEPFRTICEQGGRIVITDTLIWELATADPPQLRPSMKKLKASMNAIEIWRHVPERWRDELEKKCPYGDPLSPEVTALWQTYIATENDSMIQHLEVPSEQEKQTREGKSIIEFFQDLACNFSLSEEYRKKIESQPGSEEEVVHLCFHAVNDPDNIRSIGIRTIIKVAVKDGLEVLVTPEDVDDTWVLWHFAKSLLVIFCDSLRRGENALKEIPPGLEKRLINTGQDLNYLTELAFADALASFDKREMSYYRKWMFDDAKPRLHSLEPDKIVRFMEELNA